MLTINTDMYTTQWLRCIYNITISIITGFQISIACFKRCRMTHETTKYQRHQLYQQNMDVCSIHGQFIGTFNHIHFQTDEMSTYEPRIPSININSSVYCNIHKSTDFRRMFCTITVAPPYTAVWVKTGIIFTFKNLHYSILHRKEHHQPWHFKNSHWSTNPISK